MLKCLSGIMGGFRQKTYEWSLNLVGEGRVYEGIFLLLTTWNFARFRYVMKTFPIKKFQKTFESLDFDYFKDKNFKNIDFENTEAKEEIKKIYDKLSDFKGVEYVGATKVMHIVLPDLFVPWETDVREHYDFGTVPDEYCGFLKKMQKKYKNGDFEELPKAPTLPRAIDKYNIERYSNT